MLKFVSNLLNKASFFSSQIKTPSEEDPEQKPSFFVVVDLFIRQIHPMMDEVENLSEEKQASTDLSERTIQIMTKAQDGSATENRVEGVAIGYFKTAVTEGSYEQAALLNGNIVESYLQYNMPFTLQDLNYIDFASSKLYLPSYDDYKVDEMPVFFDMSLNDLMDSYEWHGSETIETGNSIISTGEQPEKKEPTSFYEELTNSSTIFRQNLGLFAFENTSALTFNENPSPSTIDRKHSELLLTPVPNDNSFEGDQRLMTINPTRIQGSSSEDPQLTEEPAQAPITYKNRVIAWGSFLYNVPYRSYNVLTTGSQSIAKETGRQIGLTINAFGKGFIEGLTAPKNDIIDPSAASIQGRVEAQHPPSVAYHCGEVVRETFTHFSNGAMGKPHITIRNRIQEKTLSLDERAHKFGTKIRSASIHTVRGMLGVPIKKKKNPKGLMELGSSDEQKRSTSPVLSQESLQSFLSGSTVKSGILSEQFREVDELTETRLRPTESASVRHTEDCELDELASDRAVLGLSPQADRSSFLSTDTLDELHSDSENEVDDSDDDQEESVTTSLSNILSGMSEWIQMGVKTKATSLLLDALGYALTQALKNTQERSVKEQLVDMIEEIENVKQGKGNFEELRENLTRIMNGQNSSGLQVRNMLQLHLQGIFEIPIRESREEEITSRHLLMQNIQGIPDIRESSSINYRRDMPIVQNRLVKNITALSSLQAANHLILNNMLGSQQIADILQSCDRTDPTYLENIKKRFYREVDGLDISILQKIGAKILYAIVDFSTSFSLERFISSLIKKIEELATVGTRQRTQEQHNKIIKHTNDFLCVLKGTLKRVQSNPEPTGNAQSMTEKELSQPKFNHGFTKERLYSETCSKAIAHIFPPLGWTKEFMKGYGKQNILMRTAKSIAQPVVWIAEEVSNRVIKAILHLVLSKSNIIEMVIDKSLNQVARNGYTHSINKIFYEQLRLMWIEMSNTKEGPQEADPSIANKEELRDFIINLYDVLELNRQSRHAVAESTILEKTKESLYKMSTDYSADAIALLINKAKNTFLKPELVPMREYTFMEALNSSLESTATDSEEEMIQLEQDIVQLRDAILSKAIRTVVHKSFDSGPTSTEKAFEKISNKLSSGLSKHIQQFKANLNQENKKELLEGIRNCSRMLLDLQRLAEDDPALRSEAALFDNFYTTPIAKILAELRTSAMSNERKDKKKVIVNQMQVWLEEMPKVRHINSASLPTLSSTVEGAANWIAFKAGKEFFDEAWSLMRKPYIWRYGVVHRTLIPFVESF